MTEKPTPEKHNPTPAERDERISLHGLDPEQVLEAVLKVDPESEPVDDDDGAATRRT